MAEAAGIATMLSMFSNTPEVQLLIDALEEPTIIVRGSRIELANAAARALLGPAIEGRDVRLAIRHPDALDLILAPSAGDIEVSGIGELGRTWRLHIRNVNGSVLVRMADRSAAASTERMRVDFVANASHELRTPLTAIIGYSETLADAEKLPGELRSSFARTIGDEAQRMLRIIEDLMSLSRLDADRFIKPTEAVRLAEVLDAAVSDTRSLAKAASCELILDVKADLAELAGDFDQLVQLFNNLLSNAVRYGCGRIGSEIRISAKGDGRFLEVAVADQGPGIAKEHLPRLTERFYRVDSARSRNTGGTGLGLSIVKHIVERHGGSIQISSAPGKGTTAIVRLPVIRTQRAAVTSP
jgi:two-component system phosphate regulon sensor histidine kinase PhoR